MASVFLRDGRWYLRVRSAEGKGKWTKVASAARNKTEATRLAGDLERRYERERLSLEPLHPVDAGTLGELLEWWLLTCSKGTPSHDWANWGIRKHLLSSELAPLNLADVTPAKVEALLNRKRAEGLGPKTLNHLRAFLSRAFNSARKLGRYSGPNPIATVGKRRIPRGLPEYLKAHEVRPLFAALESAWRPLFATAIYSGLRKGELFGLRKSDVDIPARLLSVARSGARETTKGGHADAIPIATELLPYLEAAISASPSALVFPREDGGMMRADTKLAQVLRRALGRAGIVTGYKHVCRKQGCEHVEQAPDSALRRCPRHNAKLWPKPQVRPIKFHALRHTTASLLMMAGASPAAVRRILRHSDQKMTDIYSHLAPEFLRGEIDRLTFEPKRDESPALETARATGSFVPVVSPTSAPKGRETPGAAGLPNNSGAFYSREDRIRTCDPLVPKLVHPSFMASAHVQSVEFPQLPLLQQIHDSRPVIGFTGDFVPVVSPKLRVLVGAVKLLSVREVAECLGVSAATVYKLVDRGELEHVRVSNSIRFARADVERFLAERRR